MSDTIESNVLRDAKIVNLKKLEEMGVKPYAYNFNVTAKAADLAEKYKDLASGEHTDDEVSVAGRIMSIRNSGMFIDLKDHTGKIQIFSHKDSLSEEVRAQMALYDIGDIIGVTGMIRRTPRGELTINNKKVEMLCKSVSPLPEKHHGLADIEIKYRKRYIDMIMNDESRETFIKRSKIVSYIRRHLENLGFLEVETPMLHGLVGGANAKPFETFHNALDQKMYLRIAPELHLKRLIVGGMDRVFEMNRCFRNEGVDIKHNPEFTSVEIYQSYADYEDMMELVENIYEGAVKEVNNGSTKVKFGDKEIDFKAPWARKTMAGLVKEVTGVDFMEIQDLSAARAKAKELGVHIEQEWGWGKILAEVFDEKVEDTLVQPIHVTDMPKEVSPLAKGHRTNELLTERFESYANCWELANAFSELNDPFDQYERFKKQVEAKEAGDEEACDMDEDFVEALEIGLPPTGGLGIGIDRMIMLLTDSQSIRDVIAFPTLRIK